MALSSRSVQIHLYHEAEPSACSEVQMYLYPTVEVGLRYLVIQGNVGAILVIARDKY